MVPPATRDILGREVGLPNDAFASSFVVQTNLVDVGIVADHIVHELSSLSGAVFHQIGEMNDHKVFRRVLSNH